MAEKEGRGQVKINFVSYEILKSLNDIGPEIARQICRARAVTNNKLIKDKWSLYYIYDKKNIVRHFDFCPNPDDKQLESAEFDYRKSNHKERAHQTEINDYVSDDDLKSVKTKLGHDREHDKGARGRERTPNIPKQLHFDGSENFQAFLNKFRNFCDYNTFNDNKAMYCLSMCLTGSASRFYEHLRQHGRVNNLTEALNQLKCRFGNNQGAYANLMAFKNAIQKQKESDEEFADRLSTLAHDAYQDAGWKKIGGEIAMRFMYGLKDHKARAYLAAHTNEADMTEMREKLQRYKDSKQIARGYRNEHRGNWNGTNEYEEDCSEEDSSESEQEELKSARKVTKEEKGKEREDNKDRLDNMEKKMGKLEEKVNENAIKTKNIENSISGLTDMMKKMQGQLDRMERNFPKEGGCGSLDETKANGLHLNKKESHYRPA